MKLIDILVEELPKSGGWLRDVKTMTQDKVGNIWGYNCVSPRLRGGLWVSKSGEDLVRDSKVEARNLAVDWNTAIITREQYEAALAAKNDGWIEWGGGECPVADFLKVEYQLRGGSKGSESAKILEWQHEGGRHDIIAYRLHKQKEAEQDKANMNECIGKDAATVWNGEYLPPVGCFCEITGPDGMLIYGHGEAGEVIAHVENTAVIRMSYGLGCFEAGFLRPLRTEAERKRDAVVEQMIKIATIYTTKSLSLDLALNSIYNSIAAGEIPGVKLEDL